MLTAKQLSDFADLAIKIGVNLQPNQPLIINSPIECADFARLMVKQAYAAGASIVSVNWRDDFISRQTMEFAPIKELENIPQWQIDQKNYYVQNKAAVINIAASDPALYEGLDMQKIARASKASDLAFKNFSKATMSNEIRWCVISVPTKKWAKKIFPDLSEDVAVDKLWQAIAVTMRLDQPDPVAAWQKHCEKISKNAEFLNDANFAAIKLKNKKGTDIVVGLPKGHIWTGAGEAARDGVVFVANMPTEEIFTVPDRLNVNGKLVNALPLCHNGNIIDGFFLEFKNGRIVNFGAEEGYDTLKGLIETDEGSHYLGEIALIGKNSPIAQLNILFFNTLFDENASCHLAIGKGYPTSLKGGADMTDKELLAHGVNHSIKHCDFMVGTPDLSVVGIKEDGTQIDIFIDGEWAI